MNKSIWFLVIAIPVVVILVYAVKLSKKPEPVVAPVTNGSQSGQTQSGRMNSLPPTRLATVDSPFVKDININYTATLMRYTFGGTIQSATLKGVPGTEIILAGKSDETTPVFLVTGKNNVFKYDTDAKKFVNGTVDDLKANLQVEIQMDYEKNGKFWIMRDVYIFPKK